MFVATLRCIPLAIIAAGAALAHIEAAADSRIREITIDVARAYRPLDRFFDLSIGADYPGTLMRPDSQAPLKSAVDELGFRYIRFHDIFHDVLGTVRIVDGRTVYDWSMIDRLYDDLLSKGIRPFVELGFTPQAMTTSAQTIFYWKGNTSHPKLGPWRDLIDAFIRHVRERYGLAEVRHWYFEVWNEPNLDGFWERADQQAYFDLYAVTARTIKAIDSTLVRIVSRSSARPPGSLSTSQLDQLQELTRDVPETDRDITVGPSGEYTVEIPMRSNDVVLVELTSARDERMQPARSSVIRFGQ